MPSPSHRSIFHSTPHLVRRDSSGSLPTSTIIVIAVACGCVAILVLSLFLWRWIVRLCRPNRSLPLPPVQPLAHQREQQLAAFTDRNFTALAAWRESSLHAPHYVHSMNSDSSLILPGTPKGSLYTDEMTTAESASTLANNDLAFPPKLSFPASPISVGHSESSSLQGVTENTFDTLSPSESAFTSEMSSSSFSATSSTHPLFLPQQTPSPSRSSRPRPKSGSRSRQPSRPTSIVSYAGSSYSGRPSSVRTTSIRGAPHSIHNNIQIVLPTPLAAEFHPFASMDSRRSSVFVDRWVSVGTPPLPDIVDGETSSSARASSLPRQNYRQSLPPELSSSRSVRSSPSPSSATRRMAQHAPPVPPIPHEYHNVFPHREDVELEMPERGRTKVEKKVAAAADVANVNQSQSAKAKPRTLKKQRSDAGS